MTSQRPEDIEQLRRLKATRLTRTVTADELARAFWEASRRRDPLLPRWDGLAVDIRRNRVADYQSMLDAGWTFTPPE